MGNNDNNTWNESSGWSELNQQWFLEELDVDNSDNSDNTQN